MKLTRLALAVLLSGAVAVACNGDDEDMMGTTGTTIADLVGTYAATQALFTLNADPAVSLDLVLIGATVTAVVTNGTGGRFMFTIAVPGAPDQVVTGDFSIDGNNATLINDADPTDPLTGTFSLSTDGNTLTLTVNDTELVDFTGDGVPDPARLDAVFVRQ